MNKINIIFFFLVLSLLFSFFIKCRPYCSGGSSFDTPDNIYTINSYNLNFDFKDPAIIKVDEYANTYFDQMHKIILL